MTRTVLYIPTYIRRAHIHTDVLYIYTYNIGLIYIQTDVLHICTYIYVQTDVLYTHMYVYSIKKQAIEQHTPLLIQRLLPFQLTRPVSESSLCG